MHWPVRCSFLADLWLPPQSRPTTRTQQRARNRVFQQMTRGAGAGPAYGGTGPFSWKNCARRNNRKRVGGERSAFFQTILQTDGL